MTIVTILDRYLAREWWKIFAITSLGFPLIAILFDVTDNLAKYLNAGVSTSDLALAYVYFFPQNLYIVMPAAVLFATVFSVASMGRHSELIAAHASGRSFHRLIVPVVFNAVVATGLAFVMAEIAPTSTARHLELLGETERRANNKRFNFVYRAEEGWAYIVRSLDLGEGVMRDVQLEREGTGEDYPTIVLQAQSATYHDSTKRWTLEHGRARMMAGGPESQFAFDSLDLAVLTETPAELLAEAKKPEEMRYEELGRYINALERSGGDGRQLKVDRALKIAVPFTCLIIALFAAPLANISPRVGGAFGVAVGLGTTIVFLILVQLSRAAGANGLLPPEWAAWIANGIFGVVGLLLLSRTKT